MTLNASSLVRTRSDSYRVERMLHAEPDEAAAYRRTMQFLKPYPSAIIFPETLLLLPCLPGRRLRRVYAVDVTIGQGKDDKPSSVQVKIRRLDYGCLRTVESREARMIFKSAQRVVEADLANEVLAIPTGADDYAFAALHHYLPRSLMQANAKFSLDVLFADRGDALRYQTDISNLIWNWEMMPESNIYLPEA